MIKEKESATLNENTNYNIEAMKKQKAVLTERQNAIIKKYKISNADRSMLQSCMRGLGMIKLRLKNNN